MYSGGNLQKLTDGPGGVGVEVGGVDGVPPDVEHLSGFLADDSVAGATLDHQLGLAGAEVNGREALAGK